jgi:hypothetical protein
MALTKQDVVTFYVALFDRAPAKEEVDYWYDDVIKYNWNLSTLAEAMVNGAVAYIEHNPEAANIYPQYANFNPQDKNSVITLIESVYEILFNKTYEDDKEGIDYWVNEALTKGLGETFKNLVTAAEEIANDDNADLLAKKAAIAFENKIKLATLISENVEKFNGDFNAFKDPIVVVGDDDTSLLEALNLLKEKLHISLSLDEVKNKNLDISFYAQDDNTSTDIPIVVDSDENSTNLYSTNNSDESNDFENLLPPMLPLSDESLFDSLG